jgi:cytochrome P450
MARDTIIAERPVPPKGRLSFPMLILRMIANPVASWGEDFYEEPAVLYRWLGLQTLYVMDPVLIQRILLDAAENYSKQPLNDDVFGEAIGGGLLNAEGDKWRWQRRLAAPLFRAEEMLAPSSRRFSRTPVSGCPTAKRRRRLPASHSGPKMGSLSR